MILSEYQALLKSFLDHSISAKQFETVYLSAVKTEGVDLQPELYPILEDLFWAVDSFSPDCSPDEETDFEISEASLRHEVQQAWLKLSLFSPNTSLAKPTNEQQPVIIKTIKWDELITNKINPILPNTRLPFTTETQKSPITQGKSVQRDILSLGL